MSGDPLTYTYFSSATSSPTWSWAADTGQHSPPAMANYMQGYTPYIPHPSPTITWVVDPNETMFSPPHPNGSIDDCIPDSWTDLRSSDLPQQTSDASPGEMHDDSDDASRRKRHTCPYCLRQMTRRHNLKVHMETHLPNRPRLYVCLEPGCGKQYTRRHDQKRHMTTHHGRRSGPAFAYAEGA